MNALSARARRLFPLLLLMSCPAARAAFYVMPTDEAMVDRSSAIVFGEVVGEFPNVPARADPAIHPTTSYSLRVEQVLKGDVDASVLTVRQPGGITADGFVVGILGLPRLERGHRVLLFLGEEEAGRGEEETGRGIVDYALGIFFEISTSTGDLLVRRGVERAISLEPGRREDGTEHELPVRDAVRFRAWLVDRVAGGDRPPDYFETTAPDGPTGVALPFRLLSHRGCGGPGTTAAALVWPRFARGESLGFYVDATGDVAQVVREAMWAWNDDPRSLVQLAVTEVGNKKLPTSRPDGVSSIMFEDPYDEIPGSYGDGGPLAVAYYWASCGGGSLTIPGTNQRAVRFYETNIVTQDGFASYARSFGPRVGRNVMQIVLTHELGHAIGLDHPCETEELGCGSARADREAVMFPALDVHRALGVGLAEDDRLGARALYPLPAPGAGGTDCVPATTALSFDGGYRVRMCWRTSDGREGQARSGIWASGQAGLLWFFDPDNAEVLVKVLNGCRVNGHRWVFVAPVTDVHFNLWVTGPDGRRWTHGNPPGRTAVARSDISAFPC